MHMEAALAGCRMMALVSTGWTTFHLVSTNECRNHSSPLCRDTISGSVGSFQSGRVLAGWRDLTIESSLSGCDQGHEPTEIASKKLWLKFPVLAPSRSGQGTYS